MKTISKRMVVWTLRGGLGLILVGALCHVAGARINTSKSIPVGLYWVSSRPVARGEYVLLCAPDFHIMQVARQRGYLAPGLCPGGFGYMMKKVMASQDDLVSISEQGVTVNGKLLPHSAPLMRDADGHELPRYRLSSYALLQFELLLMSDVSSTSFDGRYFGPVPSGYIESVIVPVLTW